MSNIKLHASTVWTLRTKKKLLEKIKKWRRRIREKYSQSEHNCFSIQNRGNTIADYLSMFNEQTEYSVSTRRNIKKCEYHENIRPSYVCNATHYLMQNSDLFKKLGTKTWHQMVKPCGK